MSYGRTSGGMVGKRLATHYGIPLPEHGFWLSEDIERRRTKLQIGCRDRTRPRATKRDDVVAACAFATKPVMLSPSVETHRSHLHSAMPSWPPLFSGSSIRKRTKPDSSPENRRRTYSVRPQGIRYTSESRYLS